MNLIGPQLKHIIHCKRCLYPSNHPLYITFDSQHICSGCRVHEEKDNIDWKEKLLILHRLVALYRQDMTYDCIVPVSGGKDSFFTVFFVKHILKLNPLLVAFNRCYNTKIGIQNLEILRTRIGCDITQITLNPDYLKILSRETLRLLGSFHWPTLAGETVFPVQMAVRFKIPLIIWGAHQGIDQVGMFSHHDQIEMTRRYRKEHDLLGVEPEMLVDKSPDLTEKMLSPLFYPSDQELSKIGVRGIYLNNYIRWDTKAQHEKMINQFGYNTVSQSRTFDTYNDIHCLHYNGAHDLIKYWKFGYTKVTDHACREIRFNRLTRKDAIALVQHYESQPIENLDKLLNWLDISEQSFEKHIDPFRDPRAWKTSPSKIWTKVFSYNQDVVFNDNIIHFEKTEPNRSTYQTSSLLPRGWACDKNINLSEAHQ